MYDSPGRPVPLAAAAAFEFPEAPCCNCGAGGPLQIRTQATTVTRYFLFFGTELTFNLPLPVCSRCEKTLSRKPPSLFHKLLVSLVVSAALCIAALVWLPEQIATVPVLSDHVFAASFLIAIGLTSIFYSLRRPAAGQTSYYQPVRLVKVKQAFVSGDIEALTFGFTNESYLAQFRRVNAERMAAGKLGAVASR